MISVEKFKKMMIIIGLIIASAVIWCLLNHSNINSMMADDNLLQWEPMIETVFNRIFSEHEIPLYDFFNHKGLDIFSSGYYGQFNPFMYFSYAVSRFLFSFDVKVLVIYMICMYCLGNVMLYLTLAELKLPASIRLISIISYSSMLFFFSYGFYYFTFNSYFFIPFFVLIMLKCRRSPFEWFAPGLFLAFAMLLGHVQYCSYYVIVYCIIQCVYAVQGRSFKPILQMFVCLCIFGILNTPLLLSMLSGADNRSGSGINPASFLSEAIPHTNLFKVLELIHTPDQINDRSGLLGHIGLGITPFICLWVLISRQTKEQIEAAYAYFDNKLLKKPDRQKELRLKTLFLLIYCALLISTLLFNIFLFDDFVYFILIFTAPVLITLMAYLIVLCVENRSSKPRLITPGTMHILFCLALIFTLAMMAYAIFTFMLAMIAYYCFLAFRRNNHMDKLSQEDLLIHALCFAALFFIVFGSGKKQVLALILFRIPVFNQFRYLYKCAYIYIPILIIICAYELNRIRTTAGKKIYYALNTLLLICSILGFANIFYLINSKEHCYINNDKFYDYFDPDTDYAEVECLIKELDIDKNYRFLTCYSKDLAIEWSSAICTYCLTKNLNVPHSVFTLSGYDPLFSKESYEQSDSIIGDVLDYHMTNMAGWDFMNDLTKTDNTELQDRIHDQLVNNGIKYILYSPQDEDYYNALQSFIGRYSDLAISRNVHWFKDFWMMEISGTFPICHDAHDKKLNITTSIDKIEFDTDYPAPEQITLSLTYNNSLYMEIVDKNGLLSPLPLKADPSGYINTTMPAGNYHIMLTYRDSIKSTAICFGMITLLLSILSTTILFMKNAKMNNLS